MTEQILNTDLICFTGMLGEILLLSQSRESDEKFYIL